jgi:DNA-binding beta-propeller fold protein YncE
MSMRRFWLFALLVGCHTTVDFPATGSQWPTLPVQPWAHQPRFMITDNRSDELSVVTDAAPQPQLLGNIVVGDNPVELEGPHHLASSPDGRYIYYNLSNYVPGTGAGPHGSHGTGTVPGSLVKLDAATGEKIAEVLIDRSPGDVILSTDGATAYITHYDLLKLQAWLQAGGPEENGFSSVVLVDTQSMSVVGKLDVCVTPHGEGLSADGKTLYVVCSNSDQLAVVDVSDRTAPKLVMHTPVGPSPGPVGQPAYYPYALTMAPDGTAWISNNTSGDVRVFDPSRMAMDAQKTVFVGGVAMFGDFSHDGATYYVPHQGDDKITKIDVATLAHEDLPMPSDACLNLHMLKLVPQKNVAIAVCEGDHIKRAGSVVTVAIDSFTISGYVDVGLFPDGAAWVPAR